jgi:hypothetical protein
VLQRGGRVCRRQRHESSLLSASSNRLAPVQPACRDGQVTSRWVGAACAEADGIAR